MGTGSFRAGRIEHSLFLVVKYMTKVEKENHKPSEANHREQGAEHIALILRSLYKKNGLLNLEG